MATGFEPVWTALQAAASPLGHATACGVAHMPWSVVRLTPNTRADDEIRTRDPHLGKVMRYHCATSALPVFLPALLLAFLRALKTLLDVSPRKQIESLRCHFRLFEKRMPRPVGAQHLSQSANIRPRYELFASSYGRLAQLVARFLHTEEVIGSSPVSPTIKGPRISAGLSLLVIQRILWCPGSVSSRTNRDGSHPTNRAMRPRQRTGARTACACTTTRSPSLQRSSPDS